MTNGSKKKVTFSDNKMVINYEVKKFGPICSTFTTSLKSKSKSNNYFSEEKKIKKLKSILVKKNEEVEIIIYSQIYEPDQDNSRALDNLNNLIKECEDDDDKTMSKCGNISHFKRNHSNSSNDVLRSDSILNETNNIKRSNRFRTNNY